MLMRSLHSASTPRVLAALSGLMSPIPTGAPSLTDDQHVEPPRLLRLIEQCQAHRERCRQAGAPLVALPSEVGAILYDLAIAELTIRLEGARMFDATSPADRQPALGAIGRAAQQVRESVDRLLDVDAQNTVAQIMQERQRVFAPPSTRSAGTPHA